MPGTEHPCSAPSQRPGSSRPPEAQPESPPHSSRTPCPAPEGFCRPVYDHFSPAGPGLAPASHLCWLVWPLEHQSVLSTAVFREAGRSFQSSAQHPQTARFHSEKQPNAGNGPAVPYLCLFPAHTLQTPGPLRSRCSARTRVPTSGASSHCCPCGVPAPRPVHGSPLTPALPLRCHLLGGAPLTALHTRTPVSPPPLRLCFPSTVHLLKMLRFPHSCVTVPCVPPRGCYELHEARRGAH